MVIFLLSSSTLPLKTCVDMILVELTLKIKLDQNSQLSACFCLPSTGIKDMLHPTLLFL